MFYRCEWESLFSLREFGEMKTETWTECVKKRIIQWDNKLVGVFKESENPCTKEENSTCRKRKKNTNENLHTTSNNFENTHTHTHIFGFKDVNKWLFRTSDARCFYIKFELFTRPCELCAMIFFASSSSFSFPQKPIRWIF